jgi:Zn-dependent metalloprotease
MDLAQARVAREEGSAPTGDLAIDEAYELLEVIYDYFRAAHYRDSVDGRGGPLRAYVHFGVGYEQAFVEDQWIVVGDAGVLFRRFTACPTVFFQLASWAFLGISGPGNARGEAGVLRLALGNVFACLIEQFRTNQTAANATWLVGEDIFQPRVGQGALYSLAKPGMANNVSDHQLDRWQATRWFRRVDERLAGVPAHAFYRFACDIGGHAWDKPGSVWYRAAVRRRRRWTVRGLIPPAILPGSCTGDRLSPLCGTHGAMSGYSSPHEAGRAMGTSPA